MSPLGFLLIAVVLSLLGTLALWLHHRRPTSMEAGIDEFHRGMKALAPEDQPRRHDRPAVPHRSDEEAETG